MSDPAPAPGPAPAPAEPGFPVEASPAPGALPPAFAEAWINREHTVCRVRLPAYSLHTHFMLAAAENVFALEAVPAGYQITWEDLWEALALVVTPYGGAVRFPRAWRCVVAQRIHRYDLDEQVRRFRAWQNDYLAAPEVFSTEGDGRPLTAPGILARAVFIQRHLHMAAREIWTMGIGQALWLHAAALEQITDSVSLLGDDEAKLFALIKRMQDGEASPDELPGEPPAPEEDPLARAAAMLGIDRNAPPAP